MAALHCRAETYPRSSSKKRRIEETKFRVASLVAAACLPVNGSRFRRRRVEALEREQTPAPAGHVARQPPPRASRVRQSENRKNKQLTIARCLFFRFSNCLWAGPSGRRGGCVRSFVSSFLRFFAFNRRGVHHRSERCRLEVLPVTYRNVSNTAPDSSSTSLCKLLPCESIVTIAGKSWTSRCHIASGVPNCMSDTPVTRSMQRA